MIQYALKCAEGHSFESWFQSAAAFDKLTASNTLSCVVCGSNEVTKAIMAPRVNAGAEAPAVPQPAPQRPLSQPQSAAEQALARLRDHVERNSHYVGKDFVREARAMHEGTAPERPIHGEARFEDARKLVEDGVPVAPLPFLPTRKTN